MEDQRANHRETGDGSGYPVRKRPTPSSSLSAFYLHPSAFPLPVKILLWFFLNVALLVAGFLLLFNAEYHFNLDWVFSNHAQQRVESMRDLIADDLNTQPPDEWDDVIDRFNDAYHVRFALFDDGGRHLLGSVDNLPAEVRARMELSPRFSHAAPSSAARSTRTATPAIPVTNPPINTVPVRSFIHTVDPTRYWLLVNARVDNPRAGGALNLNIVAESSSASMGGLIIDPMPWLRLAAAAVVLSVLFWLPLLRGITRAIGSVTHAAREIAEGRLDARVQTRRRDELGALAEAINGMAARLDGLLRGQRRFLGDVAHELCAPLAKLQMTLGIMEQRTDDHRQLAHARMAIDKAGQIASLVDQLLAFSRASAGASSVRLQAVDVRGAAGEALEREATEGANLCNEVPAGVAVAAEPDLLVRALGNLLRNAVRYGAGAGPVTVSAAREASGSVAIRVADTGPGVPEDELPKIFDAFYRVDTSRTRETGGVGLGLSIVKTCVETCGGTVMASNRPGGGLEVTIHLPGAVALAV